MVEVAGLESGTFSSLRIYGVINMIWQRNLLMWVDWVLGDSLESRHKGRLPKFMELQLDNFAAFFFFKKIYIRTCIIKALHTKRHYFIKIVYLQSGLDESFSTYK